jgi:hypothetical protein
MKNGPRSSIRIALGLAMLGAAGGVWAGSTTRPLQAATAEPVSPVPVRDTGHIDIVNNLLFCHCTGTQCVPCGLVPPKSADPTATVE